MFPRTALRLYLTMKRHKRRSVIGDIIPLTSSQLTFFTLFFILKTLYIIFVKLRHYCCQKYTLFFNIYLFMQERPMKISLQCNERISQNKTEISFLQRDLSKLCALSSRIGLCRNYGFFKTLSF